MFAPLAGIRVLDVTTSIAGPYCTLILGSLGADVVKVERPDGGDDTRAWGPPFWNGESATFLAINAGKRSVAINLKAKEGREAVQRLAERADAFVQNLRPGLAERLGLGFEALRERNPRIVYCAIGAFGRVGPLREQPGYDPLMQAAGGIMSITGEPGRPPSRAGASIVDQGTGLWAAIGILAALRAREAGAGAQLVDTSLYETAVNWVPYQLVGYLASGRVPGPLGSGIGIIAPYQAFATRDGWLMVAAGNDRLFAALAETIGLPDLAADERFATNADRVANRDALAERIGAALAPETSSYWLERFAAAGVPVAPVQDVGEVATSEQTAALGLLQGVPHPKIPELELVAPPLSFAGERVAYATPPPALGAHSHEVLREAGYSEAELDALVTSGAVYSTVQGSSVPGNASPASAAPRL